MERLIRISLMTTLILATFLAAPPSRSAVRAVAPDYEPGQIVVTDTPCRRSSTRSASHWLMTAALEAL